MPSCLESVFAMSGIVVSQRRTVYLFIARGETKTVRVAPGAPS